MNHEEFFKKHGKMRMQTVPPIVKPKDGTISIDDIYDAFKARLQDETNLLICICAEEKKKVKRPGGWVCPVHGSMTAL